MLIALGDIHFRADYPWFKDAAESFLDWYDHWDMNSCNNELVLVGDLVEKSINGGTVINFLETLYNTTHFEHLHIVVGNHDFKRIDKEYQLAYEFLREKYNVTIYDSLAQLMIEDMSVTMMPFIVPTSEIPSPYEYYSNLYKEDKYTDLLFGHVQDKNFPGNSVKNLDKIAGHICLGHIHTRVHPNYIGSIYPSNISQNGPRYYRTFEKIEGEIFEEEVLLPNFLEFCIINYGDDIGKTESLNPVYVVHDSPPENLRDSKYDGLHIRKFFRAIKKKDFLSKKVVRKSTTDYFKDFVKQSDVVFNRSTIKICKEALKI